MARSTPFSSERRVITYQNQMRLQVSNDDDERYNALLIADIFLPWHAVLDYNNFIRRIATVLYQTVTDLLTHRYNAIGGI